MSIISVSFYVFTIGALILYYLVPLRFRWSVLLLASVYFFVKGCSVKLLVGMIGMALFAYAGGLLLDQVLSGMKAQTDTGALQALENKRKRITAVFILTEMLILLVLQDNAFFVGNTNTLLHLFGSTASIPAPGWGVPLGISYYTLMLVGYLLDVSWQTSPAQKNPAKLILFTCYYPQMISGPITRYHEMQSHLFEGHRFDHNNVILGAQRIAWGLFKKLVIAERLAVIVKTIYGDPTTFNGLFVFIGIVGYTLQVYADFSGCMDMVIGVSQMFGVVLPENFQTPFYSTNLSEVWRRWHMTLGFWVKDYLLYPVLKSRFLQKVSKSAKKKFGKAASKKIPTYMGMFCTWFFVGFWHGGSWKFIFGSGLFFFVMIVGGQLLEPVFNRLIKLLHINVDCFSWRLFQRIRTFLLFASSVSFGRAASFTEGLKMWKSMFSTFNPYILFDKSLYNLGLSMQDFSVLIIALAVFFVVSLLQQTGSVREKLSRQNVAFRWLILYILLFSTIIFGFYGPGYDPADFIYAGF